MYVVCEQHLMQIQLWVLSFFFSWLHFGFLICPVTAVSRTTSPQVTSLTETKSCYKGTFVSLNLPDYWNNAARRHGNFSRDLILREKKGSSQRGDLTPQQDISHSSNNLTDHFTGWRYSPDSEGQGVEGHFDQDSIGGISLASCLNFNLT